MRALLVDERIYNVRSGERGGSTYVSHIRIKHKEYDCKPEKDIHLWYMGALVCIYILFPLLKVVFDNSRKVFIYFTVVCAILTFGNELINHFITILLNTAGLYEGIIDVNWFNDFNPFRNIFGYAFVYFCVGGLAHDFVKK